MWMSIQRVLRADQEAAHTEIAPSPPLNTSHLCSQVLVTRLVWRLQEVEQSTNLVLL